MKIFNFFKPLVEKIPLLAECYRFLRDSKSLNSEVIFRKQLGFFFNGSESMENGEFDPNETAIIENLLNSFDIFINIGANTGYFVCKSLKKGVRTIAFEPNQYNVKMLLKNVQANNFSTDFHFFPVALSNKAGVLPMYGAYTAASLIDGWMGQKKRALVPVSTFDKVASSLIKNKSCFVVIDIEGAELDCLKGAHTLLNSENDIVFLIEISVVGHFTKKVNVNPNLYETFSLMDSYGYEAYTANNELRKIELSEISSINVSNKNTLNTPNFLFVKKKETLKKIHFNIA